MFIVIQKETGYIITVAQDLTIADYDHENWLDKQMDSDEDLACAFIELTPAFCKQMLDVEMQNRSNLSKG